MHRKKSWQTGGGEKWERDTDLEGRKREEKKKEEKKTSTLLYFTLLYSTINQPTL